MGPPTRLRSSDGDHLPSPPAPWLRNRQEQPERTHREPRRHRGRLPAEAPGGNISDQAPAAADDDQTVEVEERESDPGHLFDRESGGHEQLAQRGRAEVSAMADVSVEGGH